MERRALLALVLSFFVIAIWNKLFLPPPAVEPGAGGQTPIAHVEAGSQTQAPPIDEASQPLDGATEDEASSLLPIEEHVVEADLYTARFTSLGGGIADWQLKSYTARSDHGGLLSWLWHGIKAGFKFDSLSSPEHTPQVRLLDDELEGSSIILSLDGRVDALPARERLVSQQPSGAVFASRVGSIAVEKRYALAPDGYQVDLSVELVNTGSSPWQGSPTLVVSERAVAENAGPMDVRQRVALVDEEAQFEAVKDVDPGERDQLAGSVAWYGLGDPYFLAAVLLSDPAAGSVNTVNSGERVAVGFVPSANLILQPGERRTLSYQLYVGPKDLSRLEALGSKLDRAIDFGFFSFFAYPLLALLKFFYSVVGSYGIAIILLTVSMKALTFPLTQKSMQSMQRMKEIQPEIKKLQEQHGENKEALNQEMMRLMSEKKVNPLGGCLPTVVQLPVWFALYRVLQSSIELYQTSFLYLKDLSAADPYGISPILVGTLMVLQQRMTPTASVDPTQQRMMQLMPVFFSFIMFSLPSGLVVYILVNSALSITHHALFMKYKST